MMNGLVEVINERISWWGDKWMDEFMRCSEEGDENNKKKIDFLREKNY